ncbi:hypothetical protein ACFSQJ_18335 [Croceitalea marina]|uniref:Tetratricopeptide repeat protein n=1 Tax=Croceitalea marina TaxID=1775166 RepID=A0ABW5MZQ5_9FLAO
MEDEKQHQKFRDYILDELSSVEKIEFEKRLKVDKALALKFKGYKEIFEASYLEERAQLKEKLASINNSNKKARIKLRSWMTAAIFILMVGTITWFTLSEDTDLYNDYYESYPNLLKPSTRGAQMSNLILEQAFYYYDDTNFVKSLPLFISYLEDNKDNDVSFYLAMNYLELEDGEKAAKIFKDLIKAETKTDYKEEAYWYLGLYNLKKDDTENALELFKQMKLLNQQFKRQQVEILISKLES